MNLKEVDKNSREYQVWRQEQYIKEISAEDPKIKKSIEYYESDGMKLSIQMALPNKEKYPGKRPAVLFFFGGGFHIGTPDIFKQVIEMLANQGFAALSADYRIHIYHDTTPEDSIRDGAACWKYVHENAEKWNIDPDKFVLSGGSAGAVIASLCEPMTGIMPAGLAFFYPGFLNKDMGPERLAGITGTEANGITVTNPGTVHPDLPPTLILHGEKDPIVPLENINQYTEALKENNVWCKYITFPDAGHGFMNYNKDRAYVYICVGELLLFMKKIETE